VETPQQLQIIDYLYDHVDHYTVRAGGTLWLSVN
jgi:hypothetical protein